MFGNYKVVFESSEVFIIESWILLFWFTFVVALSNADTIIMSFADVDTTTMQFKNLVTI